MTHAFDIKRGRHLLFRRKTILVFKKGPYLLYMAFVPRGIYFSCFFCGFVPSSTFGIFDKVLVKVSQVRSCVYLSNHLSESIHI